MKSPDSPPAWLKPFFWDVRPEDLRTHDDYVFIIERLLHEGDEETLRWLFQTYGADRIKEAVLAARNLTPKTAGCWRNYFHLKGAQMRCSGPFSTSPNWPF